LVFLEELQALQMDVPAYHFSGDSFGLDELGEARVLGDFTTGICGQFDCLGNSWSRAKLRRRDCESRLKGN
jgi:hypothetical protein